MRNNNNLGSSRAVGGVLSAVSSATCACACLSLSLLSLSFSLTLSSPSLLSEILIGKPIASVRHCKRTSRGKLARGRVPDKEIRYIESTKLCVLVARTRCSRVVEVTSAHSANISESGREILKSASKAERRGKRITKIERERERAKAGTWDPATRYTRVCTLERS